MFKLWKWWLSVNDATATEANRQLAANTSRFFWADWVVPHGGPDGVSQPFDLPRDVFPVDEIEEFLRDCDNPPTTMWAFVAKDAPGRSVHIAVGCRGQVLSVIPSAPTDRHRFLAWEGP